MSEVSPTTAATNLLASFASRRNVLKGTVVAGIAATGALLLSESASAQPPNQQVIDILTVARTAEQLAVTFYSNGIANAAALGLTGANLVNFKAALIEEQIHQIFFTANGGQSLATTFSFPNGPATFTDVNLFIQTQQQLEGVFDSAFLAAIREFAVIGQARLAQIAGQIACVESEHRVLGRQLIGLSPADNWAYAPVLVAQVADAPAAVAAAGYLSPQPGNTFTYRQADFTSPELKPVFDMIINKTPITVTPEGGTEMTPRRGEPTQAAGRSLPPAALPVPRRREG